MTIRNVGVVGAGILGLAIARRLGQVMPGVEVTVLEKEAAVAQHQTGHNSGVVHAGLYYRPGSLKADLCQAGRAMLAEYCREHHLPYQTCGKLVVAADTHEIPALHEIQARAEANSVPGIRWLDSQAIPDMEPYAVGAAALHSPQTAITDFAAVARCVADEVRLSGGQVLLSTRVLSANQLAGGVNVVTDRGVLTFDRLIVCAGLQSDRVARSAGDLAEPSIIPFRGEYLRLRPDRRWLVRALIYPVPDPAYPFLGVHFTLRVDGNIDVGPNAVLATAREGYGRGAVALDDILETVRWPGFRRLAREHWRMGLEELAGSVSRRLFVSRARRYVPSLRAADVERAPAGVRAQAVDRDGSLVDDFRIHNLGAVLAVRNAPSPAATSSLAIAEHVVREVLATLQT